MKFVKDNKQLGSFTVKKDSSDKVLGGPLLHKAVSHIGNRLEGRQFESVADLASTVEKMPGEGWIGLVGPLGGYRLGFVFPSTTRDPEIDNVAYHNTGFVLDGYVLGLNDERLVRSYMGKDNNNL